MPLPPSNPGSTYYLSSALLLKSCHLTANITKHSPSSSPLRVTGHSNHLDDHPRHQRTKPETLQMNGGPIVTTLVSGCGG